MKGMLSAEQVCQDDVIAKINDALQERQEHLKSSRTAALWLQYMDMIDILRKYIRAERTGNWTNSFKDASILSSFWAQQLQSLHCYIYSECLAFMTIFQRFTSISKNDLHVIRRIDRYWAGLSSDLVIEQVLMRSMKTGGGLTRGRGMTEQNM